MSSLGSPNPFFIAGKKAYEVQRSLRFNDNDNAYLNRTPSSASNKTTFTLSVWVKRASNLDEFQRIFEAGANTSNRTYFTFDGDDKLEINHRDGGSEAVNLTTTARFRDVSAWYHIVLAIDTTQSTSSDRIKIYVNGTQQTAFDTSTYPSSSKELDINSTAVHYIGRTTNNTSKFDGYMAEINFIDGFQYDPSYFGATDAITGQWNPKKYTGSYGTNGFYLNFSTDTFGADGSGNGNNFTPQNFALTDAVPDTPTNNFSTFSPLFAYTNGIAFSEGNLKATFGGSGNGFAPSTFALQSGKWYAECLPEYIGNGVGVGIGGTNINVNDWSTGTDVIAIDSGGSVVTNSSNTYPSTPSSSYTTSDIIGVALDITAGTVTFYKNNSQIYQTNLSNMSTGGNSDSIYFFVFADGSSATSARGVYNFGQDSSFVGNKTRQGNTDANGKGDFYYAPPSGHLAACSANLPDPTILLPNKHFDTLLFTANASTQVVTGLNFQPDWVWGKSRSDNYDHELYDAVRGPLKRLKSNATDQELTNSQNLQSFNSDGFTLGSQTNMNYNSGSNIVAWNWNAGDTDGKTYTVTVVSDSGNKYRFDGFGTSAVTLDLAEGGTYVFDWSDSSAQGHPIRFSTTSDGTHGGGSEYTTGVVKDDSAYKTTITVAASAPTLYYYCQNHSGMGGQVNTNSTLGSSNFDGTIQATVKANTTSGFSIVSFTGNATSGATVGHGLGVAPKVLIVKERGNANNWTVYHQSLGSTGGGDTYVLFLDLTNDIGGGFAGGFNNTAPTSSVFSLGNSNETNRSSGNFITYCFSEVAGYSKFGSYTGNGSNDGTFIYTGFRPAFVLLKSTNLNVGWYILDNKRDPDNFVSRYFRADTNADEDNDEFVDFLANGFKQRYSDTAGNGNDDSYIYLAFAESPFKNARAR